MLKRSLLWLITLLWAIGIFCFSAQPAIESAALSGKLTKQIVQSLSREKLTESELEHIVKKVHRGIRKTAHFFLYLILGVLVFLLFTSYCSQLWYSRFFALGTSALYAAGDELHQHFVPGRSCQFSDVLLDSLGAATGIFLFSLGYFMFKAFFKKR
ncbi:MAG: VanZ family protein [Clostridia bacterium]|nr:VanZ family protein [Clostridia bacterium]